MIHLLIRKRLFLPLIAILISVSIYWGWNQHLATTTCIRIPITFSHADTPILSVDIEGQICPMEFDLGSKYSLSLDENLLKKINKQNKGLVKWRDFRGDPHETSTYLIPKVNVCGFVWTDVTVREINAQTKAATYLWCNEQTTEIDQKEEMGKIGWPLLEQTNLCLDLSQGAIFSCNSLEILQRKGICPKELVQVPFHFERGVMLVQAETDIGTLNLAIDTGASFTLVRPAFVKNLIFQNDFRGLSFCTISRFAFEGKSFGKLNLYPFDVAPQFQEMDGILGMDFLKNHIIYIDYKEKIIYIENNVSETELQAGL
jgi:hypothetical protein